MSWYGSLGFRGKQPLDRFRQRMSYFLALMPLLNRRMARDCRLVVRLSKDEERAMLAAAKRDKARSVSEWLREVIDRAVKNKEASA